MAIKRYKKLSIAGVIVILLTIPFITYEYWLPEVADYLIVQDKLIPADVIVVISGSGARYQYAIKLYKEGYAKYILFNYNGEDRYDMISVVNPEEKINNLILSSGIPFDKTLIDGRCTSTYEDALYAKENIDKKQFKSAIIVSNNFHMRRVYLTFKKLFKGNDIKLVFVPVPKEVKGINPDRWWTREYDIIRVFDEYVKLGFYWYKYGI